MLSFQEKLSYEQQWYQKHKKRLSAKRKKLYVENTEYRQKAQERSMQYRNGERTPTIPADAPISMAAAAACIGVGKSTLRDWRRSKYYPEPKRYKGRLWFTQNQLSLLRELKRVLRLYKMRPLKMKQEKLKEVCELISSSWN